MDTRAQVLNELKAFALTLPAAVEEHPWGETAIKVGKKGFVFFKGWDGDGTWLSVTVKLVASLEQALQMPFAEPAGYGLGKHGWVTARFPTDDTPPILIVQDWIEESYGLIAPKRIAAQRTPSA